MDSTKLRAGMILRRTESLSLYWSNRSALTSKKWTEGKAYKVQEDNSGNVYIVDDSGYCAFITEVKKGDKWQVFPAFKDLDVEVQKRFKYQSFLTHEPENEEEHWVVQDLYEFTIGALQYFPDKAITESDEDAE